MKIKVCGMRNRENLKQLIALDPDYIGFIFYEKSSRYVTEFPDINIPKSIERAGVFVNADPDFILNKVEDSQLNIIQLHGDETTAYCEEMRSALDEQGYANIQIIKAFSVDEQFNFNQTKPFEKSCNFFLFDTKGIYYGGNSIQFDWNILENYSYSTPYFLSGGIGPDSIGALNAFFKTKAALHCVAVDVNSKFEDSPGMKNSKEIKNFKDQL